MDTLMQDLRYALRAMRKHPGFVLAAVLSLGLGIGANTAIFSVADALMFRKLPVREPDRLVSFQATARFPNTIVFPSFPYPGYIAISQINGLFDDVAAVFHLDRSNISVGEAVEPAPVRVALVSGNYFATFGVEAEAGRAFTPADDRVPGGHPVAIISDRYWKQRFSGSREAMGRTLGLNGTTYTIVGVAPARFQGDEIGRPVDLWIPMAMQSEVMTERPGLLTNPNPPWLRIVARLRNGVTSEQARSAVQTVFLRTIEERIGLTPQMLESFRKSVVSVISHSRGMSIQRSQLAKPLIVLVSVVSLVLLIACANVANLLLVRATARQREIEVRLAVGAQRRHLLRQLLTESAVLALLSGAVGLVLADLGTTTLTGMVASGLNPFDYNLHPDVRVIAFTVGLSLLTGLFFGLLPAWRASTVTVSSGLRGSDRLTNRFHLHRGLLVAQVAVSVVLLIGAGLFGRTLRNLESQDLGFDPQHLLMVSIAPSQAGRQGPDVLRLLTDLEARTAPLPGVQAITVASGGFLTGGGTASPVGVLGRDRGEDDFEQWLLVGAGFFKTLGMPLDGGHEFSEHDDISTPRVAVVNEAMALKYFKTRDAVGRRFGMRRDAGNEIEVVGVVRNSKNNTMRDADVPLIYLPYRQEPRNLGQGQPVNLFVRASTDGPALFAGVRDAVRALDPAIPVLGMSSIDQAVDRTLMQERLVAWISGLFGVLAVILACIGLFGVVTYLAARRTGEIGIRLTMGATPRSVLTMMLGECLKLVAGGVIIAIPVSLALARFASGLFFGVSPTDAVTLVLACGSMIAVGALAAGIPAWRASRLDPMVALRSE